MKKSAFIFSLEAIFACILAVSIFSVGAYAGSSLIHNYRATELMSELDTLDRALEQYSKMHVSVQKSSVASTAENKIVFNKSRIYPANLSDLGAIRKEQSYFSSTIDLSKFHYRTTVSSDNIMTYELGVQMPNGVYQISKRSNK